MLEKIKNIQSTTFKQIFAKHPVIGGLFMGGGVLTLLFLIKTVFFWSSGNNILGIILMIACGITSIVSLNFLANASNCEGVIQHFQKMNYEEMQEVIENLQKTVLIYLLGVEKGIFYFSEERRDGDSNYAKEIKRLGGLIYTARWAENFYLKLNAIKADKNLANEDFYSMIVEIQGKINAIKEGQTYNDVSTLELTWQNKDEKEILDEIKRSSNYHFKMLETNIEGGHSFVSQQPNDSLFNSTKKYLSGSI